MMQLRQYFEAADSWRGAAKVTHNQYFTTRRSEQEKRRKAEARADDDLSAFMDAMDMASVAQLERFETKLTQHETATIATLLANQEAIDRVRERMDETLCRAHVIEDGRRVFRTRDGEQVFDEYGQEVGPDIIDPLAISPHHPTWEAYRPDFLELRRLNAERAQLIEYQERLDEAREEIADGEISEAELQELDAELSDLMPPAVQAQLPTELQPEAEQTRASERDLTRQTGPQAAAPFQP